MKNKKLYIILGTLLLIIVAIIYVVKEQERKQVEAIKKSFFNGEGTSINEIVEETESNLNDSMTEHQEEVDSILDIGRKMMEQYSESDYENVE